MRVMEGDDVSALCERSGVVTQLSMLLVGEQAPGSFVLAHLGSAIRVIGAEEAQLIDEALLGLVEAVEGGNFEKPLCGFDRARAAIAGASAIATR